MRLFGISWTFDGFEVKIAQFRQFPDQVNPCAVIGYEYCLVICSAPEAYMSKVYFCSFLYVILRGVWSSKWSIRIHKNRQGLTYDWIALLGNPRHRWQIRLTHSYPTWQINKASIPWSVWLDCQHQGHRLHFCHDTARLFSFIEPASGVYFNGIFGTHSEVSRLFPEYPGSPISDNRNTWSFNPHYLVSSIDKMLMSLTGYCDE